MRDVIPIYLSGMSDKGGRNKQEDRFTVIGNFNEHITSVSPRKDHIRRSFVGVYDGHGGDECSTFLAARFHIELGNHPEICTNPEIALRDTWEDMDKLFYSHQLARPAYIKNSSKSKSKSKSSKNKMSFHRDGSTCSICLIVDNTAYIVYCGDSQIYAYEKNYQTTSFGDVHNTSNPQEIIRVQKAGGKTQQQVKKMGSTCLPWVQKGPLRVQPGGLLVTRTFGDFHAKIEKYGGADGVIINDYDKIHKIELNENIEQIVIGSDGIWDVMSQQDVRVYVNQYIDNRMKEWTRRTTASDVLEGASVELLFKATNHPRWDSTNCAADNATVVFINCLTAAFKERFGDLKPETNTVW